MAEYSQKILTLVEKPDEKKNRTSNALNVTGIKDKYESLDEVPTVAQVNKAFNEQFFNLDRAQVNREQEVDQIIELFERCKSKFKYISKKIGFNT